MTTTTMASANGSGGRVNTIGGFRVDKLDAKAIKKHAKDLGVDIKNLTCEQSAIALVQHFRSTIPEDELVECDECLASSDASLPECPLCGVQGDAGVAIPSSADLSNPDLDDESDTDLGGDDDDDDVPAVVNEEKEVPKAAAKALIKSGAQALVQVSGKGKELSTTKLVAKDLDKAVRKVEGLKAEACRSYWQLGREIARIYDEQLWKLRAEDGVQRYKGFDAFVHLELKMSPSNAFALIDIARDFTESEVRQFGTTKLSLLLKAPKKDRPELLEQIEGGATKRELKAEVEERRAAAAAAGEELPVRGGGTRADKGGGKGDTTAATAAAATARAERKPREERVTVTSLEGREVVKLFAKPPNMKNVDWSQLKRAKTLKHAPIGRLELANGVIQTFSIVDRNGELALVVETRRIAE